MVVTREQIRQTIDNLISTYDGSSAVVTFSQVLTTFPVLKQAYGIEDAIFGSGNVLPTASTPASGIAEFAQQYLDGYHIDALFKADNSVIARELYDLYMRKFTTALYALFSSVQEINRKFGGLDPDANQLSDQIITPSFVDVATTTGVTNGLPAKISGSFKNPAVSFANVLTNATTESVTIGWVNHYFTIDSSLSADALYPKSPALNNNSAFVVFGVLDRLGNVSGIKYANAKDTFSKPVYYGQTGLAVSDVDSAAHVLNNSMSLYIGQATYGYVGIDIASTVPATKSVTTQVDLLGLMFATAPIIQNNLY